MITFRELRSRLAEATCEPVDFYDFMEVPNDYRETPLTIRTLKSTKHFRRGQQWQVHYQHRAEVSR